MLSCVCFILQAEDRCHRLGQTKDVSIAVSEYCHAEHRFRTSAGSTCQGQSVIVVLHVWQVTVYRLVTSGTVDQDIHGIAQRKLRLDAAVLAGGDDAEGAAEGKASGKAGAERTAMSVILSSILNGNTVAEEPPAEESHGGDRTLPTALNGSSSSAALTTVLDE